MAAVDRLSTLVFVFLMMTAICLCGTTVATIQACSSDLDCSLNGVCDQLNRQCVCNAPWGGLACETLQIVPSVRGKGPGIYGIAPNVSSWGGNILRWSDGKFHLFVSEFAMGCTMIEWLNNSIVTHAVSDTIEGPYIKAGVVAEQFAHNPQAIQYNGELFLFHIGAGDGKTKLVNCTPASSNSPNSQHFHVTDKNEKDLERTTHGNIGVKGHQFTTVLSANSPYGPWVNEHTVDCDNPSPYVLRNGTVLLMCSRNRDDAGFGHHWRLWSAETPRGPWSKVVDIHAYDNQTNPENEDPFLWQDASGHLHVLSHAFPPDFSYQPSHRISIHGFSLDGISWRWSEQQPYNSTIFYTDGGSTQYCSAERPKLLFNDDGTPSHLMNGVSPQLYPCFDCPYRGYPQVCEKCKFAPGKSYTYTMLRTLGEGTAAAASTPH